MFGCMLACLLFIGTLALDYYIFQIFVVRYHLDYRLFREWTYVLYAILNIAVIVEFAVNVAAVKKRFVRGWGRMSAEDRKLMPVVYNRSIDAIQRNRMKFGQNTSFRGSRSNVNCFSVAGNTIFYLKFGIVPVIFDIREVVWAYGTRTPLEMPITFAENANLSIHVNDLYGVTMVTKSWIRHHITTSMEQFSGIQKLFSHEVVIGYGREKRRAARESFRLNYDEDVQKERKTRLIFHATQGAFILAMLAIAGWIVYDKIWGSGTPWTYEGLRVR